MPFTIDQTLVVLYLIAVLGFGLLKRSKSDTNSFLFAGRKLTLPAFVATLVSTWYGGILEVGRFSYENGIVTWVIFGIFYYIAAILYAKYLAPKIVNGTFKTIPELFLQKLGKGAGIISIFLVILITNPAPYIKINSILFQFIWDITENTALMITILFSLIYAFSGGFSAVVRTDKLQFILMFSGFALMIYSLFTHPIYGGFEFIKQNAPDYAFKIPGNFNWTFIFVWGFIALITFIDPGFYQRSFAGNSLKTVQKGIYISIIFWVIFDFMTVFTGIYASAIIPQIGSSPYLDLADIILPPLSKGFFIVSLMAIVMSTIDSFAFISALTIGKDLPQIMGYKSFQSGNIVRNTRIGLVLTAFVSLLMVQYFTTAIDIWYIVGSFAVPALLIPMIALFYGREIKRPILVILFPILVTLIWLINGYSHLDVWGFPQYIFNLDPMYPGFITSVVLFWFNNDNIA